MLFAMLAVLILGLQLLHRRLLRRVTPASWHRWLTPLLGVIHAPLTLYMGLRLTGFSGLGLVDLLHPLARLGLAFQAITCIHLLVYGVLSGFWAFRRWMGQQVDRGPEDPARRRFLQLKAKGENVNLASLLEEIRARDERDTRRSVAPLKPADDAMVLDSTELSIKQVLDCILSEVAKRDIAG